MKRLALFALCLTLFLTSCAGTPQAQETSIFAMDTLMSFTVYGKQSDLDRVTRTIFDLDAKLSVTGPKSLVSTLNTQGRAEDPDLAALTQAAREIGDASGGALDVTLYPVVKAWGFTTDSHRVPTSEELSRLLTQVDYTALSVDGKAVTLPQGYEADFGALAKGYAGEVCARMLRKAGVTSAILRLSGNIQTVGAKPDGTPWRVGIQDPAGGSEELLGVLQVEDQAVVTSGGYQRYFEEDGVVYHHIMDPSTGAPARSGLTSVTIISDSGTWADGLSTALFVLGREKGLDLWRSRRDFECVLVEDTGEVWITPGLAGRFTLTAPSYILRTAEG